MQIKVGLTGNDLTSYTHSMVRISCRQDLVVTEVGTKVKHKVAGPLEVKQANGHLEFFAGGKLAFQTEKKVEITAGEPIQINNLKRQHGAKALAPSYSGVIELSQVSGGIQIVLISNLEDYIFGVLSSEIPASYHLEAIKAQAVAARTYGLNPRVNHSPQGFNVCDSYLCCQYFVGITSSISAKHKEAIDETRGQILTFKGKPILALFSACAGGHTEDYQNCFSDPKTNQFPASPIDYLKGVAEGKLPQGYPDEEALKKLYAELHPQTCDAASSCFRWQVRFSADNLEGHMHHVAEKLSQDPEMAPFIIAPQGKQFGHIERFEIKERGVAGTVMELAVHTSTGVWTIKKELVIRSIFANPDLHLARLKSARLFFEHKKDNLDLLSELIVSGFGWGHGVGMQQHGAQGLALAGKSYRQILAHYFSGAEVSTN